MESEKEIFEENLKILISILLNNVPENEKEDIKKRYLDMINIRIKKLKAIQNKPLNGILKNFFLHEIEYLNSLTLQQKMILYSYDAALEKILLLSDLAFDMAIKKLSIGSSMEEEQALEFSEKMISIFPNVKPFNKSRALVLLSEGLLDISFSRANTDIISFRLANYIREHQDKSLNEEEREPK